MNWVIRFGVREILIWEKINNDFVTLEEHEILCFADVMFDGGNCAQNYEENIHF